MFIHLIAFVVVSLCVEREAENWSDRAREREGYSIELDWKIGTGRRKKKRKNVKRSR